MSTRNGARCLLAALLLLPASRALANRATLADVQSDPHFAAWRACLEAQSKPRLARPASGAGAFCGTSESLREDELRKHRLREELIESLHRRGIEPGPPPPGAAPWPWSAAAPAHPRPAVVDSNDTAIVANDGLIVFININGAYEIDPIHAARAFYAGHNDEYDFLILMTNFDGQLAGGFPLAYHVAVSNDVEGLGYQFYTHGDHFSDDLEYTRKSVKGQLQSFVHMNNINHYSDDPHQIFVTSYSVTTLLGHEVGHRWMARVALVIPDIGPGPVLLGRQLVHWSFFFNSGGSVDEGNAWAPDSVRFRSGVPSLGYGPLDLYLMGMAPASEVPRSTLWYLRDPADFVPQYDRNGRSFDAITGPQDNVACSADSVHFSIGDIVFANGERIPAYPSSPRDFRLAFMLVTFDATLPTQAELDRIAGIRDAFRPFFHEQTLGRGNVRTDLTRVPARIVFVHRPQGDVEDPSSPTTIHTQVQLEQWSLPTHLADLHLTLGYAVDGGGFTEVPMESASPGEFHGDVPPQPMGSTIRYYMRATSNFPGHEFRWPSGAPDSTFGFAVSPDNQPPSVEFIPRRRWSPYAEPLLIRALVRDKHGVADVHLEYFVGSDAMQTLPLPAQGASDIYEARLTLPRRLGEDLQYRLVARDLSLTPHVTSSPASGFHTMRLTRELYESVEQVEPMWTHRTLRPEGPDEWHREIISNHTPGGSNCWKVGTTFARGIIAARQDAVLEGPAMQLSRGAKLSFWHRYSFLLDPSDTGRHYAIEGGLVQWQDVNKPQDVANDHWALTDPDDGYCLNGQCHWISQEVDGALRGYPVFAGEQNDWKEEIFQGDLQRFAGRTLRFRFRVTTSTPPFRFHLGDGWYIDDIVIDPGLVTAVAVEGFEAARDDDAVRLAWVAREASAGDAFKVYRAPGTSAEVQGSDFALLGRVDAEPGKSDYSFRDTSAEPGRAYAYRLGLVSGGIETLSRAIDLSAAAPRFALYANRPNPFNPSTEIRFELARSGRTVLSVYDVRGKHVRDLVNAVLGPGAHRASWDGRDASGRRVASGIYLYRLTSDQRTQTRRMMLLQ